MFLVYDEAAESIIKPSRAEPSRAEPSRAEPSRAEPSRAEPSRAEPSRAEPSRAEPSLGYCPGSTCPPDFLPSAPIGAQSDPLPTDPPGAAPPSRRGEPAFANRRRGPRHFLTACIRRAADALRLGRAATLDVALTGAQPSGRSGRPSREASAARPSRGGDRRALGVGILTAGVLLTGLFAAGASAQTEDADGSLILWEAEMTAASWMSGTETCIGYRKGSSGNADDGSLSPVTFSYSGNNWTIFEVCQFLGGDFYVQADSTSSNFANLVDSNLNFHFGSTKFSSLTDALNTANRVFNISSSGLTPAAGTTYTLKFTRNQAPFVPRNLRAKGVSPTQIELSWDAPEKTGGTDVTGYKIEVSTDGTSNWTEVAPSQEARAFAHMGLMASTMLYYRVSAINAVGTGSPSGVALANTAAPPPSSFMSREDADGSLILWEAEMTAASWMSGTETCIGYRKGSSGNADDGSLSPVTFSYSGNNWTIFEVCQFLGGDFYVQADSTSSNFANLVDSNLNFHFGSTKFSSLTDALNTANRVFNISSSSLTPAVGPTYTLKFTRDQAPSAPRNLRAKAVSATEIDLSWHVPEKTGGTAVTGYKIEVSNTGTSGWTELVASQTSRTYSHTVTSGATRYYRVSAINAAGTSVASNVAFATAEDTAPGLVSVAFGDGGTAMTLWCWSSTNGSIPQLCLTSRLSRSRSRGRSARWTGLRSSRNSSNCIWSRRSSRARPGWSPTRSPGRTRCRTRPATRPRPSRTFPARSTSRPSPRMRRRTCMRRAPRRRRSTCPGARRSTTVARTSWATRSRCRPTAASCGPRWWRVRRPRRIRTR